MQRSGATTGHGMISYSNAGAALDTSGHAEVVFPRTGLSQEASRTRGYIIDTKYLYEAVDVLVS